MRQTAKPPASFNPRRWWSTLVKPLRFAMRRFANRSSSSRTRRAVAIVCVFLTVTTVALFSLLVPPSSIPSSLQPPPPSRITKYFSGSSSLSTFLSGGTKPTSELCAYTRPITATVVHEEHPKNASTPSVAPFRVIVLTYDRAASLRRCLLAARNAEYSGMAADLDVWVDRSIDNVVDGGVVAVARALSWPHGTKRVHVWDRHAGILRQWIDTYVPLPEQSGDGANYVRAIILEDDLEVSPLYYRWLRGAMTAYDPRPDVFGYTLQRGTLRARPLRGRHTPLRIDTQKEPVFLYLLVGSWGYAPHPRAWRQFRTWFHEKSCTPEFKPYVDGLLPTRWYKGQEKNTGGAAMWTMWHIRFADQFRLYTVYANLRGEKTLCANWREKGLHYNAGAKGEAAKVGQRDADVLTREAFGGVNASVTFRFPTSPRLVDWNGTYRSRSGKRTRS